MHKARPQGVGQVRYVGQHAERQRLAAANLAGRPARGRAQTGWGVGQETIGRPGAAEGRNASSRHAPLIAPRRPSLTEKADVRHGGRPDCGAWPPAPMLIGPGTRSLSRPYPAPPMAAPVPGGPSPDTEAFVRSSRVSATTARARAHPKRSRTCTCGFTCSSPPTPRRVYPRGPSPRRPDPALPFWSGRVLSGGHRTYCCTSGASRFRKSLRWLSRCLTSTQSTTRSAIPSAPTHVRS